MAAEIVGNGNPDGTVMGRSSTEKLGFYGTTTPLAKVSLTQLATTKTTTQLRAELTALQNALHNLGLVTIT
jgi:hypothetical protein